MYAALCLGLPQEDWRDWAKCRTHKSDAGMRISLSCSSDASWRELESLGLELLLAFFVAPQFCTRAILVSGRSLSHLKLGFSVQRTQDSVKAVAIAVGLMVLTCRWRPAQVCCWFQVGTDTGFQMWNSRQMWSCRTSAVFSGAAFQVFAATASAQPLHDGSSSVSGQRQLQPPPSQQGWDNF